MRSRLSVALLVVALVLSFSGGAVAAKKVTGKDVKDSTLTSRDIKDGSLTSQDFAKSYTWRVNLSSSVSPRSAMTIPAGRIVTPVRAFLRNERCGGGPVNNSGASPFQVFLAGQYGESLLVEAPLAPRPASTGSAPARLAVAALSDCGAGGHTATLEMTFEVRVGATGKAAAFR